jgi:hypothetical protein
MRYFRLRFISVMALASCFLVSCSKPATPEAKFKVLFGDLSVGVPDYQALTGFTQPQDAIKGDFCSVDLTQSEMQFAAFVGRLGVPQAIVLSSTGVWVRASSKTDPKYPWMLLVRADSTNATYHLHIEGRQPYD